MELVVVSGGLGTVSIHRICIGFCIGGLELPPQRRVSFEVGENMHSCSHPHGASSKFGDFSRLIQKIHFHLHSSTVDPTERGPVHRQLELLQYSAPACRSFTCHFILWYCRKMRYSHLSQSEISPMGSWFPPIAGVPPVCCPYGYSQIFLKNVKIISVKFLSI